MKNVQSLYSLLVLLCLSTLAFNQTTLYYEGFEDCTFPADWTSQLEGNEDAVWYVGTPQNTNADGSTIDGGCMLIIDDDITGDNTAPWQLTLATPSFDGRGYSSVRLNVDVHYRYATDEASLSIAVFDGVNVHPLKVYQLNDTGTGEQFSEFVTFSADLAFFASATMSIQFQYDDGNSWAWWAGIDNVHIIGEGEATNIVLENFNACTNGSAWETQVLQGNDDWQFGQLENQNLGQVASLNGSCMAYFDDDIIGEDAAPSVIRLISPAFDGTAFANYYLDFEAVFRQANERETFSVGVMDELTGEAQIIKTYTGPLGAENFESFANERLNLTSYRTQQMQVFFQYDDAGEWGWWIAVDNIKISGEGFSNDLCAQAFPIYVDSTCLASNNLTALYNGPAPACGSEGIGGLWFQLEPTVSGLLEVSTAADFNDVLNIYRGSCDAPLSLVCTNRDAHGFTGERLFFEAVGGERYFVLVNGIKSEFGRSRGSLCLSVTQATNRPPTPENDLCENAQTLAIDGECVEGNNRNANFDGPTPLKNPLSQADIWYQFSSSAITPIIINSNANFSDVITVYEGACGNLSEVASNENGQELRFDPQEGNFSYYLQVSSHFATTEGDLCMQVSREEAAGPANDICAMATPVEVNGNCVAGNNFSAEYNGPSSSCDLFLSAGIWYQFIAPESRSVWLRTHTDFIHNLTVFSGTCEGLKEVFCGRNPISCEGYQGVNQLSPGESYYVRIASMAGGLGFAQEGSVCLEILDGQNAPPISPLQLNVQVDCMEEGVAQLDIQANGGSGAYVFQGNTAEDVLALGDTYLVVVQDAAGCEQAATGQISCAEAACNINSVISFTNASCSDATDGLAEINAEGADSTYTYLWSNGSTERQVNNLATGTYSVTLTAEGTCQTVSFVQIGPSPISLSVESIVDESGIGNDGAIDISISGGTPPYSYIWVKEGQAVGSTQDLVGLSGGNYILQLTDANACTFVSETINVGSLVANEDLALRTKIDIQPNPSRGQFILSLALRQTEDVSIEITDVAGQIIRQLPSRPLLQDQINLDLKGQPAGVYLVQLTIGTQRVAKRVIII
ncbi:MAG: T9SS type A sorting domain-containing protein [Saprospiraceae bacterium]|nr:T9SS type A sorting domain-containing protein [Saprospiraceae bacterium]